jgi:hypothetical protein
MNIRELEQARAARSPRIDGTGDEAWQPVRPRGPRESSDE